MDDQPATFTLLVDVRSERRERKILTVLHLASDLFKPGHPGKWPVNLDHLASNYHGELGKTVERDFLPTREYSGPSNRDLFTRLVQCSYIFVLCAYRGYSLNRAS